MYEIGDGFTLGTISVELSTVAQEFVTGLRGVAAEESKADDPEE